MNEPINQLMKVRIEKMEELKKKGINPYPYSFNKKYVVSQLKKGMKNISTAGRIVSLRVMGKLSFLHLQDYSGRIQVMLRKDLLKNYDILKYLDIGDHIGVKGDMIITKTGELTILANNLELLAKGIRPLPEKYHGLRDKELRYRKRYLDLIMNPDSKERFILRSKIIQLIREFMTKKGFIEVETPVLQAVYGGARARPFKTRLHSLDMDVFLRISPELYLKRIMVGGFDKIFEIGKNFRNEGIDSRHNPEFTLMEAYWAYSDYKDIMKLVENLYEFIVKKIYGKTRIVYKGKPLNFKTPWKRLTMKESLKKYADIDIDSLSDKELLKMVKNKGLEAKNRGDAMVILFEELVEDKLWDPVFITDYPIESTPLCKEHRKKKGLIERFEPFIAGMEVGNAYSELNDPLKQKALLEKQAEELRRGDEEANPYDKDFIEALEYGMPPAGGLGLGIDRMIMVLTNAESIRDVIFFPFMKNE